MPKTFLLREISVRIPGRGDRFLTSLLDESLDPAAEGVRLYRQRGEEEVVLDTRKTHPSGATTVNRPGIFRSMCPRRILQESYGLGLAYNLIRILRTKGGRQAKLP